MAKIATLTDLVSLRTLEKIQDNFSEATGIGCVTRNLKGEVITKIRRASHMWQEVMKHPEIENELNQDLLPVLDKCMKTGQTQIFKRYIDLPAFVVPIGIDGKTYGFLIGGLVRFGNPNMELCTQEARRLRVDLDRFLTMYLELSFVTNERFEACANLLKIVASALSNLSKEGTEAKAKLEDMETLNGMLEKEIEQASVELKLTEDRYRNLFFTVQDGVYITDMTGRVKDINPAGARMLGYERGELIGRFMRDLYINPQDRDEFVKVILKQEKVYNFNPYVRLKNGQPKYFETNASVIKDQQGRIIGIQGIFRDISGRNHQNLNLLNKTVSNVPQSANQQSTQNDQSSH